MPIVEILGVKINNCDRKEVMRKIHSFLNEKSLSRVITVNPEFVLEAKENEKFLQSINKAHLSVADGIGIRFALWRYGKILKSRIAGADLIWDILEICDRKKLNVFLVTNKDGLSNWRETKKEIRKRYPFLKVNGMNLSPLAHNFSNIRNNNKLKDSHVVFCNFGIPHQEFFLDSVEGGNIRLSMGVGGSFDFISGRVRRAPEWMREIGLEWLWRLTQNPKRIKRIFRAIIIFPIKVIINK